MNYTDIAFHNLKLENEKLQNELKQKDEIIDKLVECVEFYSDVTRWSGTRIIGDHYTDFENGNASIFIAGEKARKTLKEIKGKMR